MRDWFTNKLRYFVLFTAVLASGPGYAFETAAKQAILLEFDTGTMLYTKNADEKMTPSSMSKMMTLYVLFKHLKEGSVKLDDTFTVSERAWRMEGSRSFLKLGSEVKVEDLIQGIIVQSGNDACVVVAEGIASSEEAFAKELNRTAQSLGMTNSHFVNASGMPDDNHLTTAHDLAVLAYHLIRDFPEYYHYFSEREFTLNNITQGNRNTLIGEMGVDGLKTGHTEAGGFGIALSAKEAESGRRVIVVLNGMKNMQERADEGRKIIRHGFLDFTNKTLAKAGATVVSAPVWMGASPEVALTVAEDAVVTLPEAQISEAKYVYQGQLPLVAPLKQGADAGQLVVKLPDGGQRAVKLVVAKDVAALSAVQKMWMKLKMLVSAPGPEWQAVH